MPAEIFAVLRSGDVRMLPLLQEIQRELSDELEAAAAPFLSADVDLIPLGNDAFRPDDGEAWVVPDFQLPHDMAAAVASVRTLPALTRTAVAELEVKVIGARFERSKAPPVLAFQAVTRQQIINPAGFAIVLDRATFRRLEEPGLQIGRDIHAVFDERGLVFTSLYHVRRVFDIAEHYREATNADVERFIDAGQVYVGDPEAFRRQADNWVRKRLAMIMDMGVLEMCAPRVARRRAAEHGIHLQTTRRSGVDQIVLPSGKRDLKQVLKFLSEDYYKGPLTDTPYESNSKRRVAR